MSGEILDIIGELDDLFFLDKPSFKDINKAQKKLRLRFADEYTEYVSVGGAICGGGIELTGITHHDRLNVVKVTQRERRINRLIPNNMYVVEVVGIDGLVVLQDETGAIYTVQPGLSPKKLFNSLTEYIREVGRFTSREDARETFSYNNCDEFGQDMIERIENGLIPVLPSGKKLHLHHMGLSQNFVTDLTPIVEFEESYYFDAKNIQVLFRGFDGENGYDRIKCIHQKQDYWYSRSKTL